MYMPLNTKMSKTSSSRNRLILLGNYRCLYFETVLSHATLLDRNKKFLKRKASSASTHILDNVFSTTTAVELLVSSVKQKVADTGGVVKYDQFR